MLNTSTIQCSIRHAILLPHDLTRMGFTQPFKIPQRWSKGQGLHWISSPTCLFGMMRPKPSTCDFLQFAQTNAIISTLVVLFKSW